MVKNIVKLLVAVALCSIPLSGWAFLAPEDLAEMMQNLQNNLGPVWRLLVAASYIVGICFISLGIYKLKKYGQMRVMMDNNASITGPLAYMGVGAMLIWLKPATNALLATFWGAGYGVNSVVHYTSDIGAWNMIVGPMQTMIQVIGLIAFIRGWILMAKVGGEARQPGQASKAILHIIAGTMGINIAGTIHVIENTLGLAGR